jgi:hypothetical protein
VSSVSDLLDYVHDFQAEKPLVVFFEEFRGSSDLMTQRIYSQQCVRKFQMEGHTPYIFLGSSLRKMHEIFMEPKQPFYKSALPIEIEPIEFGEIGLIIFSLFESGDRRV